MPRNPFIFPPRKTVFFHLLTSWHDGLMRSWWGIPFFVAASLVYVSFIVSPVIHLPHESFFLLWLPVTACTSLMMAFGYLAFPGMFAGMFLHFAQFLNTTSAFLTTLIITASYGITFALYLRYAKWRGSPISGSLSTLISRLIFLVVIASTLPFMLLKLALAGGLVNDVIAGGGHFLLDKLSITVIPAEVIALLACGNFTTLALRVVRKPRYLRVILTQVRKQRAAGITSLEIILWLATLFGIVWFLSVQGLDFSPETKRFLRYYTVVLFLPVLMFGAVRYGYHLTTVSWAIAVFILFNHPAGFIDTTDDSAVYQFFTVSVLIMTFSFALMLMATNSARQRRLSEKVNTAARQDPVFYMPNLRALEHDLGHHQNAVISYIHVSGMETLNRGYGMSLRIHLKRQLISGINTLLEKDEKAYHLPGYDMALRLNSRDIDNKLTRIQHYMNHFRLTWENLSIHPNTGIAYYSLPAHFILKDLNILLGELSGIAEKSLISGRPERKTSEHHVQQAVMTQKITTLNQVQRMFDSDGFLLMAQPIVGGEHIAYYEILLRMPDGEGGLISPDTFLPVVDEFGLSCQLDLWVLKHTLQFIRQHHDALKGIKFSINFTPATLCSMTFSDRFIALMQEYAIDPKQVVLEVTEAHQVEHVKYADKAIQTLRQFGCQVAIDDFGTGYASYDRLKNLQSDILKIDGTFVRDMLTDPFDAHIIRSICEVARMKKMVVVAEYVENAEQYQALHEQGVDYFQGYFIGKPVPLSSILPS